MIFNELGLTRHVLREHLAQRQAFLASRKRIEALKRLVTPSLSEDELDLAMLAVVVGATSLDVATLLFHLAEEAVAHELGLEANPASLVEAEKYAWCLRWCAPCRPRWVTPLAKQNSTVKRR